MAKQSGGEREAAGSGPTCPPGFKVRVCPLSGTCIAERYDVLGLLGSGGTSDVYLATDRESGAHVVFKQLTAECARNPQLRQRFVLGARAAMLVEHPAVARVLMLDDAGERPFLTMEPLLGEPLSEYLARDSSMPDALVVRLALDVASGLAAAHRLGIVHRDLKPANLYLLGPLGAPNAIKIIDFGLAKDLQCRGDSGPSSTGLVLGTAQYMAPEQVLADPIDARTDIYGFGAVLFRALTGQLPFDLDPGADLFSHQIFSPAPPVSWLLETVDPRLDQLVARCLRKHPENRYPSMDAVVSELELILRSPGQASGVAPAPLARVPDVYKPRNESGRDAADSLAEYFGSDKPPPPTSRAPLSALAPCGKPPKTPGR